MYIQPSRKENFEPLQIPDNYGGTAMRREETVPYPDENTPAREAPRAVPSPISHLPTAATESSQGLPSPAEFEEQAPQPPNDIYKSEAPSLSQKETSADEKETDASPRTDDAQPVLAHFGKHHDQSGIFSRFPFLSGLLPPRRQHGAGGEDIALILGLLLLLSDSKENDILPFLLILLIA